MKGSTHIPFSVCMSVYKSDNAEDFLTAIRSVTIEQTLKPSELVLVIDGPIPYKLEEAINTFLSEYEPIKIIRFKDNRGHAAARQTGLENAQNELVAIMDSDDIAAPLRFEKEISYMASNPKIAVIGSCISEFIDTPQNIVGIRVVPEFDKDIKTYLKSRCPMNLMTVVYRKSKVLKVGGFIDWFCEEDYYLWVRLAMNGDEFHNIQENLVNVRVGEKMYQRRGGKKYFISEARLQRYMLKHSIISLPRYLYNVIGRFIIQVLMPNWLRGFVFQKLFRK